MADAGGTMEDALPSKRAKFDFFLDIEDESTRSNDNKFSTISESLTATVGDSTLTSDSGFNEYTPPQSIEDDTANAGSSNQSYSLESNEFEMGVPEAGSSGLGLEPAEGEATEEDVDDACSVGSTASNLSGFSNLSTISGKDWKPCAGPMSWVQQQMEKGANPRSVLTQILRGSWQIPEGVSDFMLWHIIINMLSEPPKRERLRHINTLEDVIRLIKVCKRIIVLTGAGVSVSCGIPDFRSKDGIYARLAIDFPDLPDPQAMFDIHYFRRDPRPFFKFAREIYPGQFSPSLCHRFIRLLEQNNKLLRNYTQNIDTLEQVAGIDRVIQCHGSFATATCQRCCHKVGADVIKEDIFAQRIPRCRLCSQNTAVPSSSSSSFTKLDHSGHSSNDISFSSKNQDRFCSPTHVSTGGREELFNSAEDSNSCHRLENIASLPDSVMKPDIVFFGEGLADEFHDRMAEDKDECDLLIVIGSSLKVRPVALIPSSIPPSIPQILINREPLSHLTFDVELLGDCDIIVSELCRRLGDSWRDLNNAEPLTEIEELPPRSESAENTPSDAPPLPTPANAPHPKDESDIEALRACWAPKVKESLSARLPDGTYLFTGGHRYVFPGAEVYYDPDEEDEDSSSSSKSSASESDEDEDLDSSSVPTTESEGVEGRSMEGTAPPVAIVPPARLSSTSSSDSVDGCSSSDSGAITGFRRSSQALSEDVDSLLSGASSCSGDPASSNTSDHPSDASWGGRATEFCSPNHHPTRRGPETRPVEEGNKPPFGKLGGQRRSENGLPPLVERSERGHVTECLV